MTIPSIRSRSPACRTILMSDAFPPGLGVTGWRSPCVTSGSELRPGGLLCFALVALACSSGRTEEPTIAWKAGSASVAITPANAMWMAGYAARKAPSEGVDQDLFAKALALEDERGKRLVIVTADLIGIPRALRESVVATLGESRKLPPESILLNASHTHCGPELLASEASRYGLEPDRVTQGVEYLRDLETRLVKVVGEALDRLEPATLVYAHSRAGFAMNRRLPSASGFQNSPNPDGPVDHDVPVLLVKNAEGTLKTVLFGYACHNTTLGFQQFCGDYAGYAQQSLEEAHPGVRGMFLMGCGGDQNPYPRGEVALARHHGKTLALAVEVALQTKQQRPVRGPLRLAYDTVTLEFAPPPSKSELEKLRESSDRYDRRRGEFLLRELESSGTVRREYAYPVQVVRFGEDVTLVALAGETVVDYSLRLKRELAGDAAVWVAGYSNDVFGYVPSRRVLLEGGYEGGGAMRYTVLPGPFAEDVEERIITKVKGLVPAPLVRVIDLNVGETADVTLHDGSMARIKLVDLKETRDDVCFAVRHADVTVEVDGQSTTLSSGNYHLPKTAGRVQIDCPVTRGCNENGSPEFWGLDKAVRLRVWPAGSPLLQPGTFRYPVKQKWFATGTQMANEPVHVDGGDQPGKRKIYYHSGLDIGGSEGLVEVVAATDALVVSVGLQVLEEHKRDTPVAPRYDVVYLLDGRGWYYRYSHLKEIDRNLVPGRLIRIGDRVGLLGKEGGSGGWSHLHFEIKSRQPSGKWGTQEGYAYLWEAYLREYKPRLIAVARPHHLTWSGDSVTLDGSNSWSASGKIADFRWQLSDGSTAGGAQTKRTYPKPGRYSEILRIADDAGNVTFDFAVVIVADRDHPDRPVPSIHPNYFPTTGIRPGDPVTFKVRTFNTTAGKELWDFDDGSPKVEVQSDGNAVKLAPDGYAATTHRFDTPGDYVVRVERTDAFGVTATGHLHVHVDSDRAP